jgi:hypothetical protein
MAVSGLPVVWEPEVDKSKQNGCHCQDDMLFQLDPLAEAVSYEKAQDQESNQ